VERANGLILAYLKPRLYKELEDYDSKWIEELPKVVWGLRDEDILHYYPLAKTQQKKAKWPSCSQAATV
jgi:hypothetical protein